jgi:hypothetical protein
MWRSARPNFPAMFSVWLALRGDVDGPLLDAALREATAWHPLLGAVISGSGRHARWTQARPSDARVRWTDDCRTPVEPPDISRGPSFRVVGSRRPEGADLAFHFHHSACDGVAAIEFLGDVFAAYSQLASGSTRAEPVRLLDPRALERRSYVSAGDPLRRRIARGAASGAWFAGAMRFRPSTVAPDPARARGVTVDAGALFRLPEVRVEREQAAALREVAGAADASLNDLLLVEVLLAVREWNEQYGAGRRLRLLMPTNLRTAAQAGLSAVNVVGFEPIDQRMNGSSEWAGLLAGVRGQTAAFKQRRQPSRLDDWIALLASRPPLLDALLAAPTALYTASMSNVGSPVDRFWSHLPQKDGRIAVGDATLAGIGFAPPIFPRSRLSLGITSYDGELSITGKACPETIGAAGLERFLGLLAGQLQARTAGRAERAVAAAAG